MPRTKQRSSSSAAVSKSALEQAGSALEQLPEKPKSTWSLRESVTLLQDAITAALSRGYSHEEVSSILAGKGVDITASSLKRYLAVIKREKEDAAPKTRQTRHKAATKAIDSPVATTNGAQPVESAPAPTKRRMKRTTSTSADSADAPKTAAKTAGKTTAKAADKTTAKTAAKTKAKPTTTTAASPRSTSTRGRKPKP